MKHSLRSLIIALIIPVVLAIEFLWPTQVKAAGSTHATIAQNQIPVRDLIGSLKRLFRKPFSKFHPATVRKYTVQDGDNLSLIAQRFYGNGALWWKVYRYNHAAIGADPNIIHTGTVLSIVGATQDKAPQAVLVSIQGDVNHVATQPSVVPAVVPSHPANYGSIQAGSNWENLLTIAKYLVAHGYSDAGAAGVVACVDGESSGNPESIGSGGGGLIGWTPLPAGYVTGDPTADLVTQLEAMLAYNDANGPVAELESQTSPDAAAWLYSADFERPAVTGSDIVPGVAMQIYAALGG